MEIRSLRPDDLDALLALYRYLHVDDLPLPAPSVVQDTWSQALADPRGRYFGGFDGGQLVSSCALVVIPNLTRGCRPYGVIENVVTHAAHRNQGWGQRMLRHALQHAWAQRCYKVMLLTGRKDEATLRFYENAGFDRQGKTGFVARPVEA
jgi:GNAT superfamily N-acetyltransferase